MKALYYNFIRTLVLLLQFNSVSWDFSHGWGLLEERQLVSHLRLAGLNGLQQATQLQAASVAVREGRQLRRPEEKCCKHWPKNKLIESYLLWSFHGMWKSCTKANLFHYPNTIPPKATEHCTKGEVLPSTALESLLLENPLKVEMLLPHCNKHVLVMFPHFGGHGLILVP